MSSEPRAALAGVLGHPLMTLLREPEHALGLSAAQWRTVLSSAYLTNLMPTVYRECHALELPPKVRRWFDGTWVQTSYRSTMFSLELEEMAATFAAVSIPAMFLKGGAYRALHLPLSEGRASSDIDIMVPRARLDDGERALRERGWEDVEESGSDLDREYFRQWLHEIPPLCHPERLSVIDLHHNILPRTDRRCFDPALLWDAAERTADDVLVPCRGDLVLHCAAHLFRNGRFHHGIRDLHDIHGLIGEFRDTAGFWEHLLERAETTGLKSSLALALRYVVVLFDTAVPAPVASRVARWLPAGTVAIDWLVGAALLPRSIDHLDERREVAIWILAHLPIPRFRVMATRLFWAKRFARPEPQLTPG